MTWYRPKAKAPPASHGNQPPILPLNLMPLQTPKPWPASNTTRPKPASIIELNLVIVTALDFLWSRRGVSERAGGPYDGRQRPCCEPGTRRWRRAGDHRNSPAARPHLFVWDRTRVGCLASARALGGGSADAGRAGPVHGAGIRPAPTSPPHQ